MPSLSSFDKIEHHDTATFEIPEIPDPDGIPYLVVRLCDRSNKRFFQRYTAALKKLSKGRRRIDNDEALDLNNQAMLELLPKIGVVEWGNINGKRNPSALNEGEIREYLTQLNEHLPDVFRRLLDFCQTPANFRESVLDGEDIEDMGEDLGS